MKEDVEYLDYISLKLEELVEISGRIETLLEELIEIIKNDKSNL